MLKKDLLDEWGGFNCKLKLFRLVLIWKMASFSFLLVFFWARSFDKIAPAFWWLGVRLVHDLYGGTTRGTGPALAWPLIFDPNSSKDESSFGMSFWQSSKMLGFFNIPPNFLVLHLHISICCYVFFLSFWEIYEVQLPRLDMERSQIEFFSFSRWFLRFQGSLRIQDKFLGSILLLDLQCRRFFCFCPIVHVVPSRCFWYSTMYILVLVWLCDIWFLLMVCSFKSNEFIYIYICISIYVYTNDRQNLGW